MWTKLRVKMGRFSFLPDKMQSSALIQDRIIPIQASSMEVISLATPQQQPGMDLRWRPLLEVSTRPPFIIWHMILAVLCCS